MRRYEEGDTEEEDEDQVEVVSGGGEELVDERVDKVGERGEGGRGWPSKGCAVGICPRVCEYVLNARRRKERLPVNDAGDQ